MTTTFPDTAPGGNPSSTGILRGHRCSPGPEGPARAFPCCPAPPKGRQTDRTPRRGWPLPCSHPSGPAPLASPWYRTGCRPSPAPPAAGSMPGRDEAGQGLTKQWFWGPVWSGDEHVQRRRGQENLLGSGYGGIRSVWGRGGRRRHGVEGVAEAPAGRPGEHGLPTGPGVLELRSQQGTSGRQGQEAKGEGQVPGSGGGEGRRPRPDQEGGPPAGAYTDPAAALLTTGRKRRHLGPTNGPAAMQPHSTRSPARWALSTRCSVRCQTQGHVVCDPTSGTRLQ